MKTLKPVRAFAMVISIGAMIYSGCKKEDNTPLPANSETTTADRTLSGINEMSVADASLNDALTIITIGSLPDLMNTEANSLMPWESSCSKVAVNTQVTPHRAVIDFGTGCQSKDGNLRSGKIIILWEGAYQHPGSYFDITLENYSLNYNKTEGHTRLVNAGYNNSGNIEFRLESNGTISVPGQPTLTTDNVANRTTGTEMSYSFHGTREWISGIRTKEASDDVYLVRGYSDGTTLNGLRYKTEISNPLRNEIGYPYYTSGILNLRVGDALKIVDYSYQDNQRDDLASVTVGDVNTIIHLSKNPWMIVNIK